MNQSFCEQLGGQLGEMFVCSEFPQDLVRVRTPFWFPDGDAIDLFVREGPRTEQGQYVISDLGESLGWLRTHSSSGRRSAKQDKLIADVLLTLGVQLFKGQLVVRTPAKEIAESVLKIGQAAVRVSDIWFTMRTRAVESVTDEVADLLVERNVQFERPSKILGRSGRPWAVDFQARTENRSTLISVLTSGNQAAGHRLAEHVVAQWHDLNAYKVSTGVRFMSLVDDTTNVFQEEDFKLIESASDDIARWSRPDEFVEMLKAA